MMGGPLSAYGEKNDASIADYVGIRRVATEVGLVPDEVERLAESDSTKALLAAETDSGVARGVFGTPTVFVGEEMFWGKDRMEFNEDELARRAAAAASR